MVDFVGLLKRTIDAQSEPTPALRRRIYDRTRETVEKQMADKNVAADIRTLQRRILEKAVFEVEAHYGGASGDDVFSALQKNAGIKAAAPRAAALRTESSAFSARPASHSSAANAEPEFPAPAGAFAAYGRQAETGFPAQTGIHAAAGGNAYFARPLGESSVMSEAAYGGGADGHDEAQPRDFSARGDDEHSGAALFRFDDDEEDKNRFSPYGQSGESRGSYEETRRKDSAYPEDAFARRALDEPVAELPDFEEDFPQAEPEPRSAETHRAGGERSYYRQPYASHTEPNAHHQAPRAPKRQAPFSPYNIGHETRSEDFSPAPQTNEAGAFAREENFPPQNAAEARAPQGKQAEQDYSRDFSSLHNFLFGEAKQEAADSEPAAEREDYPPHSADVLFDAPDYEQEPPNRPEIKADHKDFSPLPDFLREAPEANGAGGFGRAEEPEPFDFGNAFAEAPAEAARRSESRFYKNGGDIAPLPAAAAEAHSGFEADVLLPETGLGKARSGRQAENSAAVIGGAGGRVASGIFAQAAIREKRRSGKKRLITGGAVLMALAVLLGGIVWFLTDFLHKDKHSLAALVDKNQAAEAPRDNAAEKANQRLTADGSEVNAAPLAAPQTEAAAGVKADTAPNMVETVPPQAQPEAAAQGEAIFREARTALMDATDAKGTVAWSLLHEKTPEGVEDTVLRGELSVPDRDIVMRMTIRPNHDKSIPAIYLVELMFVVPENFEGVAIDKISPILFKATEQSTGQELLDTRVYKINDNFFVVTLNTAEAGRNPKLQRNIALMEQLPWLSLNVAYKNGRIGEFTLGKGDKGDALFKQFFDAQSPADQGMSTGGNAHGAADNAAAAAPAGNSGAQTPNAPIPAAAP